MIDEGVLTAPVIHQSAVAPAIIVTVRRAPEQARPAVVARPRPPQGPDVRLYADGDFSRPPRTLKSR